MLKIELCPNIKYGGQIIKASQENRNCALVELLKKNNFKGNYLLLGEGSIGKSSSLETTKFYCLKNEIAYFFYSLPSLNGSSAANSQSVA